MFYDAISQKYVSTPVKKADNVLILDLHNVCDRFEPKQLNIHLMPFLGQGWQVIVLSYVGSTTSTRIGAQEFITELNQHNPNIDAYLCFQRGHIVQASNKGGFIKALDARVTHLLDDSSDHIASAHAAGARTHLITTCPHTSQQFIQDRLQHIASTFPSQ